MKFNAKYIVPIGLFLLFCKTCTGLFVITTHLSKGEMEWVNLPPKKSRKFGSPSGELMKVDIMEKWNGNYYDRFFVSSNAPDTHEAFAGYKIHCSTNDYKFDGAFSIAKLLEKNPFRWQANINGFGTWKVLTLNPQTLIIEGKKLEDCLVVDSINGSFRVEEAECPSRQVVKFVINKQYGLVYLQFKDGQEFYQLFNNGSTSLQADETQNDSIE